nr:hypothetical protein Q903MT_gene6446 [Picea sitchensis]
MNFERGVIEAKRKVRDVIEAHRVSLSRKLIELSNHTTHSELGGVTTAYQVIQAYRVIQIYVSMHV